MKDRDIYQQYMYSYPHKTAYRPFKEISLEQYKCFLKQQRNSLYFHIPFCESKCGYCNLFSVTGQREQDMDWYLDACERQAEQYGMQEIEFSDVIIGGGTPLLLTEEQLQRLFSMAGKYFTWKSERDAVIETAPNQTTKEKLVILKQNHVTRVSIGIQSFCQEELNNLCRHHTIEQARKALKLLKDADFPCLNLDLIYGIKGQTINSLQKSLEEAISYEPDEIFIYPLYIKQGTILDLKQEKASGQRYEFYCFLRDFLRKNGYLQTSMRRFVSIKNKNQNGILDNLYNPMNFGISAETKKQNGIVDKNGIVDNRNKAASCGFENTISIGCGGRSYIGNLHFCSPYAVRQSSCQKIVKEFLEKENHTIISYGYLLSEEEMKRRYVMKNLLVSAGISLLEYREKFHSDILQDYQELQSFVKQGYLLQKEDRLYLSEEGMALSDYIGPCLISEEVKQRMKEWKDIYEKETAFL